MCVLRTLHYITLHCVAFWVKQVGLLLCLIISTQKFFFQSLLHECEGMMLLPSPPPQTVFSGLPYPGYAHKIPPLPFYKLVFFKGFFSWVNKVRTGQLSVHAVNHGGGGGNKQTNKLP